MHSYRKADSGGWYVIFQHPDNPVGPAFSVEAEAAAYASFLNGGRYNPYEIEALFRPEPTLEADDDDNIVHPARPKSLEDYPIDQARK